MNCILQDWVLELSFIKQSGLISCVRGVDFDEVETKIYLSSKRITRMLRYIIVKEDKRRNQNYLSNEIVPVRDCVEILLNETLPKHWREHILYSFKIIATEHYDNYVRKYYRDVLYFIQVEKNKRKRLEKILEIKPNISNNELNFKMAILDIKDIIETNIKQNSKF